MQSPRSFATRTFAILQLLCVAALVPPLSVHAEEAPGGGSALTGDWGGQRTALEEKGVSFSLDLTSQLQSVLNGGNDETTRVLGSSEFLLDVDTDKLGLWPGGFLRVAAEGRFGREVGPAAGNLSPVSNDALFPIDPDKTGDDVVALTELFYTQFLSPQVGVFGGLLNTSGGDDNEIAGNGRSNEHFMNLSFLFSAVEARAVPNVTLGGGIILIPHENVLGTLTYLESEESAGSNPFDTGSGNTLATEWTFKHELAGLPGRQVIGGIYAWNNEFFRLGEDPRTFLGGIVQGQGLPETDDTWSVYYNMNQALYVDPDDEERQWGVFLRLGYADDESNPIHWTVAGGLGGVGLIPSRPRDRFGVGVYYLEPSDKFPLPQLGIQGETGVEVFYNAQLLPWLQLTADLQYIDTGRRTTRLVRNAGDDAWVGGLRARIIF